MYTQSEYDKVLDYYFENKKFPTPNRRFFEAVTGSIDQKDFLFSTPWTVSWQVVSQCNLRCRHCFFEGNKDLYKSDFDLDSDTLLQLANELNNKFSVVSLSITGGETMFRKDIFELLKTLKRNNVAISLQTNGTLIDKNKAQLLSDILNVDTDFVQVSLDGSKPEIYDKIRGEKTFDKALNGINLLIEKGIKVNVNATALSLNVSDLPDLYTLCNNLNVKKFSVSRFVPCYKEQEYLACEFSSVLPSISAIIDKSLISKTFFEMNYRFYDFVSDETLRAYADEYLKKTDKKRTLCNDISCHRHNTIYINAKGEFYLCFACENEKGCLGTFPKDSLEQIWENRKHNIFFKPREAKASECKKCKYFPFCTGGCMGSAFGTYGNVNAPDGLCVYAK